MLSGGEVESQPTKLVNVQEKEESEELFKRLEPPIAVQTFPKPEVKPPPQKPVSALTSLLGAYDSSESEEEEQSKPEATDMDAELRRFMAELNQ